MPSYLVCNDKGTNKDRLCELNNEWMNKYISKCIVWTKTIRNQLSNDRISSTVLYRINEPIN